MAYETTSESTEALLVTGGVGTGKTARVSSGALPRCWPKTPPWAAILVLCATPRPHACSYSGVGLARVGADAPPAQPVTTAALTPGAPERAGRRRRAPLVGARAATAAAFEETFLMEDMKVSGLRPGGCARCSQFFYRSWTELADDDPDWLLPGEEADVHTLLKENLVFMRRRRAKAANLAARYLREHDEARAAHSYAHVLMDDYACASRASQTLANLVATCSITVAGDAETCIETYDSYPYAAGIDEFLATHPDAACEHLDADAPDAVERVALASDTPEAEFEQVARTVAEAVAAGTPARQIVVAVPNSVWSRNIATALHARGVPTEALAISQPLRGDVRDNARCTPARIATALNLVANPDDTAAWRCWCGFGDYLVNSAAFASLRTCAKERSIGLVDALEMLSENDCEHVVGAQRVATTACKKTWIARSSETGTRIAGHGTAGRADAHRHRRAVPKRPPFCASSASSTATQPMKTRKAFTMPMLRRWRGAWPSACSRPRWRLPTR